MSKKKKRIVLMIWGMFVVITTFLWEPSVQGDDMLWRTDYSQVIHNGYATQGMTVTITLTQEEDVKKVHAKINGQEEELQWDDDKQAKLYFGQEGNYTLEISHDDGLVQKQSFGIELSGPKGIRGITNHPVGKWTNQNMTLQASGGQCLSGIACYQWRRANSGWKVMDHNQLQLDTSMDDIIYLRGVSVAGNNSDVQEIPVKMWKKTPKRPLLSIHPEKASSWYTRVPKITDQIVYSEGPGITSYVQWKKLGTSKTKTRKNEVPKLTDDGKYIFYTWSADEAGNVSEPLSACRVYLDRQPPKVTIVRDKKEALITVEERYMSKDQIELQTTGVIISPWKKNGHVYTARVSFTQEGEQRLFVRCRDEAGNVGEATMEAFSLTKKVIKKEKKHQKKKKVKDRIPPTIMISGVNQNTSMKRAVTPIIIVKDNKDHGIKPTITLNGKPWTPVLLTEDGHYRLEVTAKDRQGNRAKRKVSFTINQQGITIAPIGFPKNYSNQKDLRIGYDIDDVDLVTVKSFTVNGKEVDYQWKGEKLWMKEVIRQDGLYRIRLSLADAAGNQKKTKVSSFIYDRTKPEVILSGLDERREITYGETISVGLSNQKDHMVKVTVDGKAVAIRKEGTTLTNLEPGQHVIRVIAKDRAGNQKKQRTKVFVKKILPSLSSKKGTTKGQQQGFMIPIIWGIGAIFVIICAGFVKKQSSRLSS